MDEGVKTSTVLLVVLIGLLIICGGMTMFLGKDVISSFKSSKSSTKKEVVDDIKDFGYQLHGTSTDYVKELFKDLKKVINDSNNEKYEEEYAKVITQIFLADFYDLNSKSSKADVGGVQFVYEDYREAFKNLASERGGIYYYIKNDSTGKRDQELPEVKKVEINSIKTVNYTSDLVKDEKAYQVNASIQYKKNLGYANAATLILVHAGEKLEIVEMN